MYPSELSKEELAEWEAKMLKHESDLLRFSELPEEKIERCWAHFEFEG